MKDLAALFLLIYFINHFCYIVTILFSYFSVVQVAELAAGEQVGNSQLYRGRIRIPQWAAAVQGTECPGERS